MLKYSGKSLMRIFVDCEFSDFLLDLAMTPNWLVAEAEYTEPLFIELNDGRNQAGCASFVLPTCAHFLHDMARSDCRKRWQLTQSNSG